MKRALAVFSLITLLLMQSACGGGGAIADVTGNNENSAIINSDFNNNKEEAENFPFQAGSITENTETLSLPVRVYDLNGNNQSLYQEYEYDEYGRVISMEQHDNPNAVSRYRYQYDSSDQRLVVEREESDPAANDNRGFYFFNRCDISFDGSGRALKGNYYDENGVNTGWVEWSYNDGPRFTSEISYDTNGVIESERYYTYDDRNNLLTSSFDSESASIHQRFEYTYDSNGNKINFKYYSDDILWQDDDYEYDFQGHLVNEKHNDSGSFRQYIYYENGCLAWDAYTNNNGERSSEYTYTYSTDADGYIVARTEYCNGEASEQIVYEVVSIKKEIGIEPSDTLEGQIDAEGFTIAPEDQEIMQARSANEGPSSPYGEPVDEEGTIFKKDDNITIVDDAGNALASQENGDFDNLCAYGGGYYVLHSHSSGFDYDNDWIVIIDRNYDEVLTLLDPSYSYYDVSYCGNGIFAFHDRWTRGRSDRHRVYDYYICSKKEWITIQGVALSASIKTYKSSIDRTDSMLLFDEDVHYDYVQSEDTEITIYTDQLGIVGILEFNDSDRDNAFGGYSDGGFIYYTDKTLYFYDCDMQASTKICKDSDKVDIDRACNFKFVDGQAEIKLKGADGQTYTAIVDKQGNYIEDPHT